MNFEFENATNISDYLTAIAGRDEFVVAQKDGGYTVINYQVMMADTFPDPATATTDDERRNFILRRDCRGIKFSTATGAVICRPYHKFFNAGEREETLVSKIDLSKPHVILEKMDGCLTGDTEVITPFGKMTLQTLCNSNSDVPVLGYDHSIQKNVWTQVFDYSIKESADNWYEVTTDSGQILKVTGNHKVWCTNRQEYVRVDELNEGDEVKLVD